MGEGWGAVRKSEVLRVPLRHCSQELNEWWCYSLGLGKFGDMLN